MFSATIFFATLLLVGSFQIQKTNQKSQGLFMKAFRYRDYLISLLQNKILTRNMYVFRSVLKARKIDIEESSLKSNQTKKNRKVTDNTSKYEKKNTSDKKSEKSASPIIENSLAESNNTSSNAISNNSLDTNLSTISTKTTDDKITPQRRQIDPEIVFFGDSRTAPPIEAAQDARYHGSLLLWARHGDTLPRDSIERRNLVLPFAYEPMRNDKYRLSNSDLTYDTIFNSFVKVMDNIAESKIFISTNLDLVPSVLFLRALTAKKLKAQYENNIEEMNYIKTVRQRYTLAHDQLFFPLNIEVRKAETRVMTYLSRAEFPEFAKTWDTVETTLHFVTLVSARITWDLKVQELLDRIRRKISETVDYMADAVRNDLMTREFRRPGITAEVYGNATIQIEKSLPEIYRKIAPEIRIIHETYDMTNADDIKRYLLLKIFYVNFEYYYH